MSDWQSLVQRLELEGNASGQKAFNSEQPHKAKTMKEPIKESSAPAGAKSNAGGTYGQGDTSPAAQVSRFRVEKAGSPSVPRPSEPRSPDGSSRS